MFEKIKKLWTQKYEICINKVEEDEKLGYYSVKILKENKMFYKPKNIKSGYCTV